VFDGKDLVVPCSYEGDDIDAIGPGMNTGAMHGPW